MKILTEILQEIVNLIFRLIRNSNASLIQCSKLVFEGVSNLNINLSINNESNFTQINV